MAELVGAFGVPHTPAFPALVAHDGPGSETAQMYAHVETALRACGADLVIMFDSDHLNTFFFDNLPAICVPTAECATGPNDATAGLPERTVVFPEGLGGHLLTWLGERDFDPARSARLTLDHSVLVPLHFLDPLGRLPVLPVLVNGVAPPLPRAARAHALGREVAAAIRSWDVAARVAVVASGSFSLEVGGPRIRDGAIFGVPDPDWARHVARRLRSGEGTELLREATADRMLRAGNVAGELLNWIALLGAVHDRPAATVAEQPAYGHAYAVWEVA